MVTLKNIFKDFKVGKENYSVLKNISLCLEEKGFISIYGPSGCGKTTLLNIIGGLDRPTKGTIFINNKDTKDFSSSDWDAYRNNCIGFVFQGFNLIENLSAYSNVEIALRLSGKSKKIRHQKVLEALKRVGLEKIAKKKPNQLSGGEQQRVAIARAIVNNPDIILADEPTGALDSTNSQEIIRILKELSQEHLVVLVTHNEELTEQYSDRIIRLKDGEIAEDNIINQKNNQTEANRKISKVHMSIIMATILGFKNIYSKLLRTFLTILAGSIGIVAVSLVLTVSEGVNTYIEDVQSSALEDYPIIIRSNTVYTTSGNLLSSRVQYPDTNEITVTRTVTNYEQVNNLDADFIDYIDEMNAEKYTILNYNRSIRMRLIRKNSENYSLVSTSYFTELINDTDFLLTQYDVIAGEMPTKFNEVALVVDMYNSISSSVLNSLGIENDQDYYTFDSILSNSYHLIDNQDYYYYDNVNDIYRARSSSTNYEYLYNQSSTEIKIVAILREKPTCSFSLYSSGIVYTSKLTDYIIEKANESDVVRAQIECGLEKNVLTGNSFEEQGSSTVTYSKQYLYDNNLLNLGAEATITRVNIYSQTFEDRLYIEDYIKGYEEYATYTNITYSDYMSTLTNELTAFIEVLTKVLLILAMISLIVSSIMVAIITYISVIERTKEIGILRSVGARRFDIGQMFCTETFIIGLISGILGVFIAYIIRSPINKFVQNVLSDSLSLAASVKNVELINFNYKLLIIMVFGSALLTLISGLIPAIIASFKKPINALKTE